VASAISQCVKKLCLHEPISPIEWKDDEWMYDERMWKSGQNKRCSALFKDEKWCFYLDAIIWKNQNWITYTWWAYTKNWEEIRSRQYVNLPFTPKSFYIDIIEEETIPHNFKFTVKNEDDLKDVFKYYTKIEPFN
jgi:hypothetical protein